MSAKENDYPAFLKHIRDQLGLSQEGLARALGVSWASVSRWENGLARPSKLAKAQLDLFCAKMSRQGKLKLDSRRARPGSAL